MTGAIRIVGLLCASKARMQQKPVQRFGAERIWRGMRSPDQIMEPWQDRDDDGTMVVVYVGGGHCSMAMGSALDGFIEEMQGSDPVVVSG